MIKSTIITLSYFQELLREMESGKEADQENYWLIQYQKLMDMKPDTVVLAEENLDPKVCVLYYFCFRFLLREIICFFLMNIYYIWLFSFHSSLFIP